MGGEKFIFVEKIYVIKIDDYCEKIAKRIKFELGKWSVEVCRSCMLLCTLIFIRMLEINITLGI